MQSAPSTTASSSQFAIRGALPSDDAERRALLASVAMDSELALSIRRSPTVDAMYPLHASAWDSWGRL